MELETTRRTKIVATLGPASHTNEGVTRLIKAGVDVFRLNFSHGDTEIHQEAVRRIRRISRKLGREVAILQDLCGPRIRLGALADTDAYLKDRQAVILTTRRIRGRDGVFPVGYNALTRDIRRGHRILINDGRVELKTIKVVGRDVHCRVTHGGPIASHKGINLPDTPVSASSFTAKDRKDLATGLAAGVDFVALSFVRHPRDLRRLRRAMKGSPAGVIAKIEKPEAIEFIDQIIEAADGIMVARGDLGLEMDITRVPVLQKDLIARANAADKFVITATQMLESMTTEATPTRAEVSDVANAILDGTDAVMLSGETAIGKHPARTIRMMDAIAKTTEHYLESQRPDREPSTTSELNPVQDAIGQATLGITDSLAVKAVVAHTVSGRTARYLSKSRPHAPILVFSGNRESVRRMRIYHGVIPVYDVGIRTRLKLLRAATAFARKHSIARRGDRVLLVCGPVFGQRGSTNMIEIATVN